MAYITAADAKGYIGGISGTGDEALITSLIDQVQGFIEDYLGFSFESSADVTYYFDAIDDVDGSTLWLDGWWNAITSLTTNADAAGGGTALTKDTDYITLPRNKAQYYKIRMLQSSSNQWEYTDDKELGIKLIGRRGWSSTAPNNIKQATLDIVKTVYRSRDANVEPGNIILASGTVITPAVVPSLSMKILNGYRYLV